MKMEAENPYVSFKDAPSDARTPSTPKHSYSLMDFLGEFGDEVFVAKITGY